VPILFFFSLAVFMVAVHYRSRGCQRKDMLSQTFCAPLLPNVKLPGICPAKRKSVVRAEAVPLPLYMGKWLVCIIHDSLKSVLRW
jgi:hypothetical protein